MEVHGPILDQPNPVVLPGISPVSPMASPPPALMVMVKPYFIVLLKQWIVVFKVMCNSHLSHTFQTLAIFWINKPRLFTEKALNRKDLRNYTLWPCWLYTKSLWSSTTRWPHMHMQNCPKWRKIEWFCKCKDLKSKWILTTDQTMSDEQKKTGCNLL